MARPSAVFPKRMLTPFSICWPSSPATGSINPMPPPMRLLAYQTAYLKANYPIEFMAAIMTLDQGNTDKVKLFFEETRVMEIEDASPLH